MVDHICAIIINIKEARDLDPKWLQFLECLASSGNKGVKENQVQIVKWLFDLGGPPPAIHVSASKAQMQTNDLEYLPADASPTSPANAKSQPASPHAF